MLFAKAMMLLNNWKVLSYPKYSFFFQKKNNIIFVLVCFYKTNINN